MRALKSLALGALACALLPASANAKGAPAAKSVVLAPLSSLSVSKPKALVAIEKTIEAGLAKVPKVTLVTARKAAAKADQAKRPELRSCEGSPTCLAELGTLVSAQYAIYAEVGGLGDAQVVYLKLIDVKAAKELRSTLIELSSSGDANANSLAAATRLLAPKTYVGTLKVETPVRGAVIYVDGQKRGTTPSKAISGTVGSHALRVTHPEHSDYVRFVDIEFGKTTSVSPELKPLPGVSQRLSREGIIGGTGSGVGKSHATPWYLRWYSIAGGVAVVGVSSAILFSAFGGDINFDAEKNLDR
jgi:hypothetical protein